MTDKQPTQAMGEKPATHDDGVEDAPAKQGGGESGGGAYPNPHKGKEGDESGFLGHGGQTEIAYSGPDNDNAVAK